MSWKTRKRGKPRQIGQKFKTKTRYWRPKYYRKPFSLTDPQEARKKVEELQRAFKYGYTRKRRKAIKMALVSAANKALANGNPEVAEIYRKGYENMSLEKNQTNILKKPKRTIPIGDIETLFNEYSIHLRGGIWMDRDFLMHLFEKEGWKREDIRREIDKHVKNGSLIKSHDRYGREVYRLPKKMKEESTSRHSQPTGYNPMNEQTVDKEIDDAKREIQRLKRRLEFEKRSAKRKSREARYFQIPQLEKDLAYWKMKLKELKEEKKNLKNKRKNRFL
ncbi:MAG: hypothetical protein ACTSPG_10155 [Candidatus Hodarchaeales archaeon]